MSVITLITFFNLVIYYLIYILSKKSFWQKVNVERRTRYCIFILSVLFCIIPFWGGDYFHYMEIFPILRAGEYQLNIENIYTIIARLTQDYHIFRLFVWGGAIVLICICIKLLKLRYDITFFLFTTLFLYKFSYARVSLAMSLMYIGSALLLKDKNIKKIFGIIAIIVSFYFHKSAIFGIAVIIITPLFLNNSRFKIYSLLLLFPLFVLVTQYFIGEYLAVDFERDGMNFGVGQQYMTSEIVDVGIGEHIMNLLWRGTIYMIAFLYIKVINDGSYLKMPKSIRLFATASFLSIYVSSFFIIDLGINTTVIYNRFLNFCMLPSVYFLSYCHDNGIHSKIVKFIVNIGTTAAIYALLYSTYLNNINTPKYLYILDNYLR